MHCKKKPHIERVDAGQPGIYSDMLVATDSNTCTDR